ncbi:MAG: Holliday junction resolvase RuvX [Pseudomonadota bacterium]|nr:Holliday junction resolvase RuvX [Pseudomonadota bacterium]
MTNLIAIEDIKARHASGKRLLGLDLGTRTIGLALSDVLLGIATPWRTIKRTRFTRDAAELASLAEKEGVFAMVVGLPLNMDGSEGPRAQATRAFVRNLEGRIALPVVFWDERLSTVAAERVMIEADLSRAKRAERIDAAAAAVILQGALDRLARLPGPQEPGRA